MNEECTMKNLPPQIIKLFTEYRHVRKRFNALYWGVAIIAVSLIALAQIILLYSPETQLSNIRAGIVTLVAFGLLLAIWYTRKQLAQKAESLRYDLIAACNAEYAQQVNPSTLLQLQASFPLRAYIHVLFLAIPLCEIGAVILVIAVNDPPGMVYAKCLAAIIALTAFWAEIITQIENAKSSLSEEISQHADEFRLQQINAIPYDPAKLPRGLETPRSSIAMASMMLVVVVSIIRVGASAIWIVPLGIGIGFGIVLFYAFYYRKDHLYAYKIGRSGEEKTVDVAPLLPRIITDFDQHSLTFRDPKGKRLPLTIQRNDIRQLFTVNLPDNGRDGTNRLLAKKPSIGINYGVDPVIVVGKTTCMKIYKWYTEQ